MKMIVVSAAPRMEKGNTQALLTPFLVGAKQRGAVVDFVTLRKKNIKQCIGCFNCYAVTPGQCVHHDDMAELTDRVRNADTMVLASPVYLDGLTSFAKTFLDRMVVFLDPHFAEDSMGFIHPLRWNFPKRLFLFSVCGYPGMFNFDPVVQHMERVARNFHTEFAGALLRPAVFSIHLTGKYPEKVRAVIDAVRRAGEELVLHGKPSQETLEAAAADICSQEELMKTANSYWDRELEKSGDKPA